MNRKEKKVYKKAWKHIHEVYADRRQTDYSHLSREEQVAAAAWWGDMQALLGVILPRLKFSPKPGFAGGGETAKAVRDVGPVVDLLELLSAVVNDEQYALPPDVVKEGYERRRKAWGEKQEHPQGTIEDAERMAASTPVPEDLPRKPIWYCKVCMGGAQAGHIAGTFASGPGRCMTCDGELIEAASWLRQEAERALGTT